MKILKKLLYAALALSLIPVLTIYFAYGSKMDMMYFAVTFMFFVGVSYLVFATSKGGAAVSFSLGVGLVIIQLDHLKYLWFVNTGSDLKFPILFTLQSLCTVIVLILLLKDSRV